MACTKLFCLRQVEASAIKSFLNADSMQLPSQVSVPGRGQDSLQQLKVVHSGNNKTYTVFFFHSLKWRKHQTYVLNMGFPFHTHKLRLLITPMYHDYSSYSAFKSACLVVKIMVYGGSGLRLNDVSDVKLSSVC